MTYLGAQQKGEQVQKRKKTPREERKDKKRKGKRLEKRVADYPRAMFSGIERASSRNMRWMRGGMSAYDGADEAEGVKIESAASLAAVPGWTRSGNLGDSG